MAENAEDHTLQKTLRTGIAENAETLPLFNAEDQTMQKTQVAMAIRKTQRREKTRNIKI